MILYLHQRREEKVIDNINGILRAGIILNSQEGDRPLNRPQRELIERVQEVKSDKVVISLLSDK